MLIEITISSRGFFAYLGNGIKHNENKSRGPKVLCRGERSVKQDECSSDCTRKGN